MTTSRLPAPPRRLLPVALATWSVAWFLALAWHGGAAWHFFVEGGQALADFGTPGGGLHVYAGAPVLQIGPLAFLAVDTLTTVAGRPELLPAQLLGVAAGGYVLWQAQQLGRRRALAAGVFFTPVWMYLAVASTHLDDVLALTFAVAGLAAARSGRPWWTGILLGLAVDAACLTTLLGPGIASLDSREKDGIAGARPPQQRESREHEKPLAGVVTADSAVAGSGRSLEKEAPNSQSQPSAVSTIVPTP